MSADRLRWVKFWPQDWHGDKALRTCSMAARGLWMELLCIAHDGTPYGHVTINGRPASAKQIANIAGIPERDAAKWLGELEDAGVFSRTEDGCIFSRRMVRDKALRDEGAANGRKGGNPKLKDGDIRGDAAPVKAKSRYGITGGVNPPLNLQEAEAEAEEEGSLRSQRVREDVDPPGFAEWWAEYPRKDAKGDARKAYAKALKRASPAALLTGLRLYPFQRDPKFIPMPATWINQGRWESAGEAPDTTRPLFSEAPSKTAYLEKYMKVA